MRITVQLVDVSSGFPLWSDSFDRGVEDILQVQDDIARSIVEALRGRLLPASAEAVPGRSEVGFEGYDLYLRGRYLWHRRTGPALRDALRLFEEAVSISPGFARGYVGVGDAYAILGFYEFLAPEEAFPRARDAALRALELDATLAPAHATLGYVALYHEWNWERAEAEFRRAIELDPGYSTAHQWYGNYLTAMGRFADAEAAMRRAMELDPLSLIANAALGWVYYYGGEPARAIEQLRRTHELDSEFDLARLWEGQALEELGRYEEAVAAIEEAAEIDGGSDVVMAALARARALHGRPDLAMEVLEGFGDRGDESWLPAYDIARVHEALGDHQAAFLWLQRALDGRSHSMVFLQVDPAFSGLRSDPRFDELVRTVGLPPLQ
jgi:tetratricopeptide (TPR) repeat protein